MVSERGGEVVGRAGGRGSGGRVARYARAGVIFENRIGAGHETNGEGWTGA